MKFFMTGIFLGFVSGLLIIVETNSFFFAMATFTGLTSLGMFMISAQKE